MPPFEVYALKLKGAIRVGRRGLELEDTLATIPSDTLFSALTSALTACGEDPAAFLQPFLSDPPQPPFLLTSTFPYAGGVRFYPAPLDWTGTLSTDNLRDYGKRIKKVQFLSEGLFRRLLQGEPLDEFLFPKEEHQPPEKGVTLQGWQLWLTVEEVKFLPPAMQLPENKRFALRRQKVWQRARQPHVTVDRIRQASDIFHTVQIHFQKGCGLWFGVQWLVDEQHPSRALLRQAVDYLQLSGLGGKRSIGFGGFEVCEGFPQNLPWELPTVRPGEAVFLLSRYHPRPAELPDALKNGRYQLISVGGWSDPSGRENLLRQRVLMVSEGSRLFLPEYPAGNVCDVSPRQAGSLPHPIYRYGLACGAGLKAQGGKHA
ncbi:MULTISPECIES: type III-A CRISPR-associated RAMP protein Csm4 [Anaerolinea]|uniref:type III-A CRISPR-associated RAMP protein Csm4 n=1 Tax=Anaerolinea TaxID=233189 RepID=UPI00260AEC15|nr:type III-A CRISPR-associated RAMP protein Csm4 [Anaerolinea thermophila]